MSGKKAREYDEFERLKKETIETVSEKNAQKMLKSAKNQTMEALQKLDVNKITQVENLYLIVAQLTQAASYVAAINRAKEKRTSFDDALSNIGADNVNSVLIDAFKDHSQALNLNKINTIDNRYQPSKEAWAGLHGKMLFVAAVSKEYHTINVLNDTVTSYKKHLEVKLRENGIDISIKERPKALPGIIKKLIARYEAVVVLENRIQGKEHLGKDDVQFVKDQVKICMNNKPDWSELPFIQKLTDVLSLGLKSIYRSIFSKEKDLQKTIEHSLEPPKIGG